MIWRLRMHRLRRLYGRLLLLLRKVGIGGAVIVAAGWTAAMHLGLQGRFGDGWIFIAMGGFLLLGGIGHALAGDAPGIKAYAEGETEEMPGIVKLFSGLMASSGGVLLAMMGIANVMGS